MEPIILASSSPRRQEILKRLGIPYTVVIPDCNEIMPEKGNPEELAELNAMKKLSAAMKLSKKEITAKWILSADTLISQDGKIFGKPADRDSAYSMLETFSGKEHEIITTLCFFGSGTHYVSTKISRTKVFFADLSGDTIDKYLETGEWQGAAGAYKIQGLAACFIKRIDGSYSGAVGLPVDLLYEVLLEHKYSFIV